MIKPLNPALIVLIDALARRAAQDYLIQKSAPDQAKSPLSPNHVDLPDIEKAA